MAYIITSIEKQPESILTIVTFQRGEDIILNVPIQHSLTSSKEDIIKGIENREISEFNKKDLISSMDSIIVSLQELIGVTQN